MLHLKMGTKEYPHDILREVLPDWIWREDDENGVHRIRGTSADKRSRVVFFKTMVEIYIPAPVSRTVSVPLWLEPKQAMPLDVWIEDQRWIKQQKAEDRG